MKNKKYSISILIKKFSFKYLTKSKKSINQLAEDFHDDKLKVKKIK